HYTSYIAPDIFVPLLTLYIKLALLCGGLGNNKGAIVGAFVVVFLLESTRFVIPFVPGVTPVQAAAIREFLVAAFLLVMLRYKPTGIVPERLAALPITQAPKTRYQPTA
ncbi:MAG TPA: branched-chain amino acid ABC transporter permease, partial [Casimicrobiaceae bacterium]|nr:branched-chain amino acid ABC transporter permease [Casimicrobiaceae bacterium]